MNQPELPVDPPSDRSGIPVDSEALDREILQAYLCKQITALLKEARNLLSDVKCDVGHRDLLKAILDEVATSVEVLR